MELSTCFYLLIMSLQKIDRINIEFQSEYFRIHKVFASITDEYRNLLAMFIKPEVMQTYELSEIGPLNVNLHKKMEDIDVGGRCENLLRIQMLGDKEYKRWGIKNLNFVKMF